MAKTVERDVARLIQIYREQAIGHGTAADSKAANRCHDKLHEAYICLKSLGEEGREALGSLMDDASPYVRAWAAAHALFINPAKAEKVLTKLATMDSEIGWQTAFSAKMTLEEWRKGRLTFDY